MNGVPKTYAARGVALAAIVALFLGIGSARGAFPAANGLIVFSNLGAISTVSSSGLVTPLVSGNNPAVSPNGQTVAYDSGGQVFTIPIGGGSAFTVTNALGSEPAWSPDGATLFYTSGPTPPDTTSEIMKVAASGGATTPLTSNAFIDQDPAVSPDGTTVAFASKRVVGNFEIYVMDTSGGSQMQVSGGGGTTTNTDPTWAPDGTRIAYVSDRSGTKNIYDTTPTGAGGDLILTAGTTALTTPAYSPDGTLVALSAGGVIATIPAAGGTPTTVIGSPSGTSPDYQNVAPINTLAPAITPTGVPILGETLTGSQGTWATNPTTTYAYLWLRCNNVGQSCAPIGGATSPTYVVQLIDIGPTVTLKMQVTGTNAIGSTIAYSSPAGHLPDWPVNLTAPLLSGAPKAFPLGSVISGTTGTWSGLSPITYSFQWLWCDYLKPLPQCEPIPGATSSSYAPSGDYINHSLQLKVTAKNSAGSDSAVSQLSAWVLGDLPKNTISPKILPGAIEVGSTLTTDTGTFFGSTPLHYTYQWVKCVPAGQPCTPIPGATSSSYVLQPSDQGATVRSQVTAANGGGSDVGVSNHTFPILPKTRFGPKNTDPPTVDGKPVVGSTLVGSPGTWTGEAPLKYTYTWLRCDATGQDCNAIPNAASSVYKLKLSESGFTIKLLVTGRNALGAATVNSDQTVVVTELQPQPAGRKITGTSKNDYLAGGGGNDTIHGGGGNDTIKGGAGDDYLYGDGGNDVIDGGPGADHIYGGKGSDTIFAVDGERDTIDCGPGLDRAYVDAIDVVKNCETVSGITASPLRPH